MASEYNKLGKDEELELEIRIPDMSQENFNDLYSAIMKLKYIGKIEESILALANAGHSGHPGSAGGHSVKRMEMYFNNGVRMKGKDQYIEKKKLEKFAKGKPVEYIVKLANEKKIDPFNTASINEYRFRLRSSIMINDEEYPEFNNWRFDFTFTRMIDKENHADLIQRLPELRDEFFQAKRPDGKKVDVKNYLEFEPPISAKVNYEVELEWVPDESTKKSLLVNTNSEKIKSLVAGIEQLMPLALGLVDDKYYERLGYHQVLLDVAQKLLSPSEALEYKSRKTLKNLVNRPKSFTKSEWNKSILPEIDNYYVSDKADGERAFLIMGSEFGGNSEDPNCLLLSADRIIRLMDVIAPEDYQKNMTVCDVEIMGLKIESSDNPGNINIEHGDIYLFDVLIYKGKNISREGLEEREKHLDFISRGLGEKIHKKILLKLDKNGYREQIKKVYHRKERNYKIDGLIFTESGKNYRAMNTWKWKPAHELTIDFLIIKIPTHLVGTKPYVPPPGHTAFWLFSGIYPKERQRLNIEKIKGWGEVFTPQEFPNLHSAQGRNIIPIQFTTPSNPYAYIYYHPDTGPVSKIANADDLHKHVGEFVWITDEPSGGQFGLKNMRPDKDIEVENGTNYGNAYKVALDTFMVIHNPVTIADLTNIVGGTGGAGNGNGDAGNSGNTSNDEEQRYFLAQKQEMYKPAVKFNNFVVAQLLRMCEDKDWIVDLAAGRGSHIFVYNGFGVKNGLFIDNDKNAIEELTKRTEAFGNQKLYLYGNRPKRNMKTYTKIIDLGTSSEKVLKSISDVPLPHNGVDVVVSTFAIHYFVGKSSGPGSIHNLIEIVDGLLKPGGLFIFTCFDGSRIRELLEEGGIWNRHEGGQLKYSIKRVPGGTNRISVIHPFSEGEYYDEYIVDVENVLGAFEKAGYIVQQNGSFGDWLHKFQQFNARMFNEMSTDDKLYTSLYQYVSVWKPLK